MQRVVQTVAESLLALQLFSSCPLGQSASVCMTLASSWYCSLCHQTGVHHLYTASTSLTYLRLHTDVPWHIIQPTLPCCQKLHALLTLVLTGYVYSLQCTAEYVSLLAWTMNWPYSMKFYFIYEIHTGPIFRWAGPALCSTSDYIITHSSTATLWIYWGPSTSLLIFMPKRNRYLCTENHNMVVLIWVGSSCQTLACVKLTTDPIIVWHTVLLSLRMHSCNTHMLNGLQ